jgi:hypothetical protein
MTTRSNGRSNRGNRGSCGELLAGRSTARMSRRPQRWLPASARRLPSVAVGLFIAISAAVISVVATCAIAGSHAPISGRSLAAQPLARSGQSSADEQAAGLIARPAPQGSDLEGFVGYPGARCNSANPAVAIGRTSQSLVVICQTYDGRFYCKRLGLQNGLSVELQNFVRIDDTFGASNNGIQYQVSPAALIIKEGQATVSVEPMLEYWSV